MASFSQRIGLVPLKMPLQRESITTELRNGLWSLAYEFYWQPNEPEGYMGSGLRLSPLEELIKQLWSLYFKLPIDEVPEKYYSAVEFIKVQFYNSKWYVPYEIIEFLASSDFGGLGETFSKSINRLLERENAVYRFVGNLLVEVTSKEELSSLNEALKSPWTSVATHIQTALKLLTDKKDPNFRNSIKESISAVEAACILIDGNKKATISSTLSKLPRIHKALAQGFGSLYGYTSDADGIRHALMEKSDLSYDDAKYMLVVCSAFVNYLISKAPKK